MRDASIRCDDKKNGARTQPFVVAVGNILNPEKVYVVVQDTAIILSTLF